MLSYALRIKRNVFIHYSGRVETSCNENTWLSILKAMELAKLARGKNGAFYLEGLNQIRDAALHSWDFTESMPNRHQMFPRAFTTSHQNTLHLQSDISRRQRWKRSFLGEAVTQGLS